MATSQQITVVEEGAGIRLVRKGVVPLLERRAGEGWEAIPDAEVRLMRRQYDESSRRAVFSDLEPPHAWVRISADDAHALDARYGSVQ